MSRGSNKGQRVRTSLLHIRLLEGPSSPWPAPFGGCSSWERLRARRDSSEAAGRFYLRQQRRLKDLLLSPSKQAAFLSMTADTVNVCPGGEALPDRQGR